MAKVNDGTTWTSGGQGPAGVQGPPGNDGAQGPAGPGVPTGGVYPQVVAKVDATNYNTVWANPGAVIFATAAARDSAWTSPPNGALCVTVDSNSLWQRIGGSWRVRPGGEVGYNSTTTGVSGIAASNVEVIGVNVAVYSGHKYRVTGACWGVTSSAANDTFNLFLSTGTGFASFKAITTAVFNTLLGATGVTVVGRYVAGADNASLRFAFNCIRVGGSGTGSVTANGANSPIDILVEDMGS